MVTTHRFITNNGKKNTNRSYNGGFFLPSFYASIHLRDASMDVPAVWFISRNITTLPDFIPTS